MSEEEEKNRMKIAIIDDSSLYREKIKNIIRERYDLKNIFVFTNVQDYEMYNEYFDLLLLDIELGDELSISYVKKHVNKQRFVIYVTSHSELMMDAFHYTVSGFVPKDQMEECLLSKVVELEKELLKNDQIAVHTLNGAVRVKGSQILYVMFSENTVCMKIIHEKSPLYLTARSLVEILNILPENYYKVNRNYVVNLYRIKKLIPEKQMIIMEDDNQIKVSNRLWKHFLSQYHTMRYQHD